MEAAIGEIASAHGQTSVREFQSDSRTRRRRSCIYVSVRSQVEHLQPTRAWRLQCVYPAGPH